MDMRMAELLARQTIRANQDSRLSTSRKPQTCLWRRPRALASSTK